MFCQSYYVCVGSFTKESNAKKLAQTLQENEIDSSITQECIKGILYNRVLLLPGFESIKDAKSFSKARLLKQALKPLGIKDTWVCKANIKTSSASAKTSSNDKVLSSNDMKNLPTNANLPYSVKIRSYKEETLATNAKNRLEALPIDTPYIEKTYNDGDFSFNLHSGSFATESEAENLQEKIANLGINDTELSNYDDTLPLMQNYDNIIQASPVVYNAGEASVPTIFSPHIVNFIKQFPINRNFIIDNIIIADMDNIESVYDLPQNSELDLLTSMLPENAKIHALAICLYRDDIFSKNINVMALQSDSGAFDKLTQNTNSTQDIMPIMLPGGSSNFIVKKTGNDWLLLGCNKEKDTLILLQAKDFSETQFKAFIDNIENDSSLLVLPQIRKSLLILPDKMPGIENKFLYWTLDKVNWQYAQERGQAEWARQIVGHYCSSGYFKQDDKDLNIGFFDLDYNYNAQNTHNIFKADHSIIDTDTNHALPIYDTEGWYISNFNGNEISFASLSYIIAVDSGESERLTETQLLEVAKNLRIWNIK